MRRKSSYKGAHRPLLGLMEHPAKPAGTTRRLPRARAPTPPAAPGPTPLIPAPRPRRRLKNREAAKRVRERRVNAIKMLSEQVGTGAQLPRR
jgi:hypothetical protein